MQAKREQWQYQKGAKVWVGRYKNSHNMPHWHYDCELLYVEHGELDIFCNGVNYRVRVGDEVFIDSEQVHYMHARDPQTVVSMIIFDYDLIKPYANGTELVSPVLSGKYAVNELYLSLRDKLAARTPFSGHETALEVANAMLNVFMHEKTCPQGTKKGSSATLKDLLQEIDEKYEFYDLNTAAKFMNVNAAYFSRMFHKLMGMTFSQYLNYVKTSKAVDLINSGSKLSLTEISLKCGFTTIRNFNRIFKTFTGYTPSNLPENFIMKENFADLNDREQNPTMHECVLIESSDDFDGELAKA